MTVLEQRFLESVPQRLRGIEDALNRIADALTQGAASNQPTDEPATPVSAEMQAVDLGLPSGTLWGDRNVGAKSPEDVGLYFSWGNTDGHEFEKDYDFSEETYKKTPGAKLKGDIDLKHDAARANCGEPWQMPSDEQFKELDDNCEHEMVSVNGVRCMRFTSKINGKSIHFSCSGYGGGASRYNRGSHGLFWSSTFNSARRARYLNFDSGNVYPQNFYYRYYGFPVRPVQN